MFAEMIYVLPQLGSWCGEEVNGSTYRIGRRTVTKMVVKPYVAYMRMYRYGMYICTYYIHLWYVHIISRVHVRWEMTSRNLNGDTK